MKRCYVVLAVMVIMALFVACSDNAINSTPQDASIVNVNRLAKTADSLTLATVTLGDYSAWWPQEEPNLVIWYFGGSYLNDETVYDFIPGFAWLDLSNVENTGRGSIVVRKRGDNLDVSPHLFIRADSLNGELLADVVPTEEFSEFFFQASAKKIFLVFDAGDIDLSAAHADINIDVKDILVQ